MDSNLLSRCRAHPDSMDWLVISSQELTEDFIREFSGRVYWVYIAQFQRLSESFIAEFADKFDWSIVSAFQNLSESFIRQYANNLSWSDFPCRKSLSESLIRDYYEGYDVIDWSRISKFQTLTEDFMRDFSDYLDWEEISNHQTLSEQFINDFDGYIDIPDSSWRYKTAQEKLDFVDDYTGFSVEDGYVIAYKPTNNDGYSVYCRQSLYEVGETYTVPNCDCLFDSYSNLGLNVWTLSGAPAYGRGRLLKVEVAPENIGVVLDGYDGYNKMRCFEFRVLSVEVP